MGLLAQNPSQSAAWLKPACDWATFGNFGGSRQSTVRNCLDLTVLRTEISVRFHPWGAHTMAHTHTHRNLSPTGITKSSPGGPADSDRSQPAGSQLQLWSAQPSQISIDGFLAGCCPTTYGCSPESSSHYEIY
jgi:hypothetical protein